MEIHPVEVELFGVEKRGLEEAIERFFHDEVPLKDSEPQIDQLLSALLAAAMRSFISFA
jgi:hypothetical protein